MAARGPEQRPRRRPGRRGGMPERRTGPFRHVAANQPACRLARRAGQAGGHRLRGVKPLSISIVFESRPFESRPGIRDGFFFVFELRRNPMPDASGINLSWWITVVELPMLAALFWLIWHV